MGKNRIVFIIVVLLFCVNIYGENSQLSSADTNSIASAEKKADCGCFKCKLSDNQKAVVYTLFAIAAILLGTNTALYFNLLRKRKIQRCLETSQKNIAQIIDHASLAVFIVDKNHIVTHWNKTCEVLTGIPANKILGTSNYWKPFYKNKKRILADLIIDNLSFSEIHKMYPSIRRSVLDNNCYEGEVFLPDLDKGKWLYYSASQLHDIEGNCIGAVETLRDITSQKQTELAIAQNEEKFRLLFENGNDAIIWIDAENRTISNFNKATEALFDAQKDEILGKKICDFMDRDKAESCQQIAKEQISICGTKELETEIITKTGQVKTIHLTFSAVQIGDGKIVQAVLRDITEIKLYQKNLINETSKLSTMISGMDEGIVFTAMSGQIIEVNPYFEKLVNKNRSELLSLDIEQVLSKALLNKIQPLVDEFKLNKSTKPAVVSYNFNEIIADVRVQPIYQANQLNGILLNIVDVSSLVTAKEDSEKLNSKLQQISRQLRLAANQANTENLTKSEFLANMSHDIRTPMNAILGFSELLSHETLTDDQKKFVNLISESGNTLLALINDILDLSKIESGKLEVENIDCSVSEIVDYIEVIAKPLAIKKNLPLKIELSRNLPAMIKTDPIRLKQCLTNFVSNAIKFTDNGYVKLQVYDIAVDGKTFVRFDVEDTGVGIPENKQETVFEPYAQANSSTSRYYGGTGLGLAIVKKLAHLMDGQISLKSTVGKGSVFSILLPSGLDAGNYEKLVHRHQHQHQEVNTEISFKGRVLIAEDNPANQRLIAVILEKMGLDVILVSNGQFVIEKALSEHFDLIIMDTEMPFFNGNEATKVLRSHNITTPIITLTANLTLKNRVQSLTAGCNDYLTKPIDRKKLILILHKYLSPVPLGSTS